MAEQEKAPVQNVGEDRLVLGIDTCGPSGSVALGRLTNDKVEVLGQTELAGRSYSATLVTAVSELLTRAATTVKRLGAIVVVNGPGSFTGVRVGLSAAKGLAEPTGIPVVAVSRLAVLALKAAVESAALDAHRHEVFLRIGSAGGSAQEMLAGAEDLTGITAPAGRVAVCDEAAEELLRQAWPGAGFVRVVAPMAADALALAVPRIVAGEFEDLALLDGHYLRRSDAEIFGEKAAARAAESQ